MELSIDWESLLEFEGSLQNSFSSSNKLLVSNLERKIEQEQSQSQGVGDFEPSTTVYLEPDLESDLQNHDYEKDAFITCSTCGNSLNDSRNLKTCCKTFISYLERLPNTLEKHYILSFMNNPSNTINTLPNCTELFFLRQAMSFQLRPNIWRRLFLLKHYDKIPETSQLVFSNFQHSYNNDISKQINKDMSRTFPLIDFFKDETTITSLSTILNVYANYDAELGYCQGLLFLVGVLFHHLKRDSALTFHALITIMQTEEEVHDIFTSRLMSTTLNKWKTEFLSILKKVDGELFCHLNKSVDCQVFLFQWWMSFLSSHVPDTSIVNRLMDYCIFQGWKVGMFKISLGLLLVNKPILLTLGEEDEEVVYQHLLNEGKWGMVAKDLNNFFGELLLSWDDELFANLCHTKEEVVFHKPYKTHTRSPSSVIHMLKNLSVNISRTRSNSDDSESSIFTRTLDPASAHSSISVFSMKLNNKADGELDSLYSMSSNYSMPTSNYPNQTSDSLKVPSDNKSRALKTSYDMNYSSKGLYDNNMDDEVNYLKSLLRKAHNFIDDRENDEARHLKGEIYNAIY